MNPLLDLAGWLNCHTGENSLVLIEVEDNQCFIVTAVWYEATVKYTLRRCVQSNYLEKEIGMMKDAIIKEIKRLKELKEKGNKGTLLIIYQREGRCFWHSDCKDKHGGIMQIIKHEEDKTLLKCLHCGKKGYYPVGGTGMKKVEELTNK